MHKIVFANQLRGIAAISVVISHYLGVYWGMRELVATYTMSPVQTGGNPFSHDLIGLSYFNFGSFGVALFFLISGFVIPFTLEKCGRFAFLVARFFRIYPTYIACLLIELIVIWASAQYWGKPFAWNGTTIISNMSLFPFLFGKPTIDLVNWTLAIEIEFYFVVAVLADSIRRCRVWVIFLFGFASLLINWQFSTHLRLVGVQTMFISYMFIGTFFWHAINSRLSYLKLFAYSAIQLTLCATTWKYTTLAGEYPAIAVNYLYGFVVFSTLFAFRDKFKEAPFIDFFADISYPMYAIHSLVGYSIIKIVMSYGIPFYAAGIFAFLVVCFIAYFIHRQIELPSTIYGKNLRTYLNNSAKQYPAKDFERDAEQRGCAEVSGLASSPGAGRT
jgi:peptidoglycan/LPS O-acetylase OafA/YrhL